MEKWEDVSKHHVFVTTKTDEWQSLALPMTAKLWE